MTDPNYEPRFDQPEKSTPGLQTELQKQYDDCEPKPIFLLVAFKLIPATLYLILKLATDIPMLTFILTMVLVCVDFWTTKNYFGRKLAGLRWYTKTVQKEDKWISESSQTRVAATINLIAFWVLQLVAMLFWVSIGLINLFTLSPMWVFLGFFCCVLLFLNFIFFMNCKGGHQRTSWLAVIRGAIGKNMIEIIQFQQSIQMRLRENEEDAFAKHLKTTKQEMNSTPIRTREAVKENVLSNSGEPTDPLNTSKTINRKKSIASKTCANHLENQAEFKIVIDGENFHYCPKCAAHLASNGFQVERIASKSPLKSRERPQSVMYKSPQNSRKTELSSFLGQLKHLQEGFKQKNEAMGKVAVSYEVEKVTISNVYASMVEYIEYVRDEHLKFLDDSAERNVETCRVASGELFDALEEISAIREDIQTNMGKILTKELDEESYSECMGFYKQKHSMLEQRLEDLGEEAQPIVLTTSEAVDEKLEAFKEFFDDLTGLRNSKY